MAYIKFVNEVGKRFRNKINTNRYHFHTNPWNSYI